MNSLSHMPVRHALCGNQLGLTIGPSFFFKYMSIIDKSDFFLMKL
jgi:hypothetical protein